MENNQDKSNQDQEHLRLLSIFHYVAGGLGCLFTLFPLIYVALGIMFLVVPELRNDPKEPGVYMGIIFLIFGIVGALFVLSLSISILLSGKYIKKRSKYMFSFIVACIQCIWVPFGTVLGIFTIIVLSRPSVKKLYGR